ncbi:hypothetical protein [Xylophilus sp. GOD-11R]|uniref:hypothetical protein n=1 Tax=Xylophilus sp. GOD-11R TaxID=3089814 RepID=UPI00298D0D3C|nr:hypothetical protein [Xylophilus sp. GOD-11R]WPB55938.1 hypothetical protein R9X41_17560 [Xylophilus sp. GOD-11R]
MRPELHAARLGLVGGLMCLAALACAAPAPWYLWRSLSNGSEACAQASPGEGWSRVGGPFVDARCRRPLRVVPL